ncbi:hypothetical protein PC122_g20513, partial [Phytophthora cactorum]
TAATTGGIIGSAVHATRSTTGHADVGSTETTEVTEVTETTETATSEDVSAVTSEDVSGDVTRSVTERGGYTVTSGWTSGTDSSKQTTETAETTETTTETTTEETTTEETTVTSEDVSGDKKKVSGVATAAYGVATAATTGGIIGSAVHATRSTTGHADVGSTETTEVTEVTETTETTETATSEDVSAVTSEDVSGDVTRSVTERGGYTVTSGWTSGTDSSKQTTETAETTETTTETTTEETTTEETTVTSEDVSGDKKKVSGVATAAYGVATAATTGGIIGSAVHATRSTTGHADVGSTETTEVTEVTETTETATSEDVSAVTSEDMIDRTRNIVSSGISGNLKLRDQHTLVVLGLAGRSKGDSKMHKVKESSFRWTWLAQFVSFCETRGLVIESISSDEVRELSRDFCMKNLSSFSENLYESGSLDEKRAAWNVSQTLAVQFPQLAVHDFGLEFGQYKRVLMIDEVSSEDKKVPDAANAQVLTSMLKESPKLSGGYKNVLITEGGETVFYGSAKSLIAFFQEFGFAQPQNVDVTEFLLSLGANSNTQFYVTVVDRANEEKENRRIQSLSSFVSFPDDTVILTGTNQSDHGKKSIPDDNQDEDQQIRAKNISMLASPLEHVEAEILRKATKGLGTTEEWIYPVVMARSNKPFPKRKWMLASDVEPELGESSLLDQLHDLHRRLAAVRQDSQRYTSLARNLGPIPMANDSNKIIVCSLRRCVRMLKTERGDSWQYIPSATGLKSAIDYLGRGNTVRWVSWPGANVDESSQDGVRRRLETDFACHPVFLGHETLDLYQNQFCNVVLWPLFHSLPQRSDSRLLENFGEKYDAYCSANQKFLEAVSEIYKDGDLVLVCDYQLMALPGLLRRRFPEITCGFYFHCPFPSSEFFQMLPVREALLHGVLGADLVVFNHFDYVRHFLNVCKYALTPKVEAHVEMLKRQQQEGMKIIVGVHKLDFCKGIPEMLEAMDYLLQHYPEYRGKVVLYAVVRDAGRTASLQYRMLSRQINELVGRVNGRFGTAEYCPVRYLKQSIDHTQLVALYNCADVAIVSSIKEGINLQAMEFIAAQKKSCHGVLVYSEFAGCASSFQGALLVNPMHIEQVAASVDTALRMNTTTKRIRHHQLSRYVNTYTSTLWAQRIMSALNEAAATAQEYNRLDKLDTAQLLGYYERSQRRLFLLDYDGTLVNYQSMEELAEPSPALMSCLEDLTADPHSTVYIISGRNKNRLQEWFRHLPRVGLAAEHGYWFRPASKHPSSLIVDGNSGGDILTGIGTSEDSPPHATDSVPAILSVEENPLASSSSSVKGASSSESGSLERAPWQCMFSDVELEWRDEVESILEHFTERTPGSLLDVKDCCYTWHFRDADPTFGLKQAKDMQLHFDQMLRDLPVGVVMCRIKKYVMIRPWRVNKGRAVSRILEYESETPYFTALDFDFILALGDERTDEDMFDVVQGSNCYTCTVGMKVSRAQYYLEDPDEVLRVLTACTSLMTAERQPLSG